MQIRKVHKSGVLFTFDELNRPPYNCTTNVYVIVREDKYFLCDTYLGPFYMKKIKEYLESNYGLKEYIVFNSHHHWDHVWGNCDFKDSKIISHRTCKDLLERFGQEDLNELKNEFAKDEIEIILPNITFEDRIVFEEDGIEFFYSPGHSEDSSSCYDHLDKTLFVGDNMDEPIPSFFCWNDLETYKATLEHYLTYKPKRVIQSHGDPMGPEVITQNIKYLDDLMNDKELYFKSELVMAKHKANLDYINKLKNDES